MGHADNLASKSHDLRFLTVHQRHPQQRRVIYPQLVGVNPDCETLELKGQLTVDEISVCRRVLLAPYYGVNGQEMTHSVPIGRFSASLIVENVYALVDALLVKRRWDDPEV
jgi:hypothetical protein